MRLPTASDMAQLKRLGRYLVDKKQAVITFKQQKMPDKILAFVDTDFAGCLRTRKSTTGFTVALGQHHVYHGSNLQSKRVMWQCSHGSDSVKDDVAMSWADVVHFEPWSRSFGSGLSSMLIDMNHGRSVIGCE